MWRLIFERSVAQLDAFWFGFAAGPSTRYGPPTPQWLAARRARWRSTEGSPLFATSFELVGCDRARLVGVSTSARPITSRRERPSLVRE